MSQERPCIGGRYRWYFTIKKNTSAAPTTFSAWDLDTPSTAVVTVTFYDPDGNATAFTATVDVANDGTAYYDNAANLFDERGIWSIKVSTTQGTVVTPSEKRAFMVYA